MNSHATPGSGGRSEARAGEELGVQAHPWSQITEVEVLSNALRQWVFTADDRGSKPCSIIAMLLKMALTESPSIHAKQILA